MGKPSETLNKCRDESLRIMIFSHHKVDLEKLFNYINMVKPDLIVYVGKYSDNLNKPIYLSDPLHLVKTRAIQCFSEGKIICGFSNYALILSEDHIKLQGIVQKIKNVNKIFLNAFSSNTRQMASIEDFNERILSRIVNGLKKQGFPVRIYESYTQQGCVNYDLIIYDNEMTNYRLISFTIKVKASSKTKLKLDYSISPIQVSDLLGFENLNFYEISLAELSNLRVYLVSPFTIKLDHQVTPWEYLSFLSRYGVLILYLRTCDFFDSSIQVRASFIDSHGNKHYMNHHGIRLRIGDFNILGTPFDIRGHLIHLLINSSDDYYLIEKKSDSCKSKRDIDNQQEELEKVTREKGDEDLKLLIISYCRSTRGVKDDLRNFLDDHGQKKSLIICICENNMNSDFRLINDQTLVIDLLPWHEMFDEVKFAIIDVNPSYGKIDMYRIDKMPPPLSDLSIEEKAEILRLEYSIPFTLKPRLRELLDRFGEKFVEDLPELSVIKNRYHIPWQVVFDLYEDGIKSRSQVLQLNEDSLKKLEKKRPIFRYHIQLMRNQIQRDISNSPFLLSPLPFSRLDEVMITDSEYMSSDHFVLIGFYDPVDNQIHQFPYSRLEEIRVFVKNHRDRLFIHYGGADSKIIEKLIKDSSINTFDLLQFVLLNLVVPSRWQNNLSEIHEALCGHKDDPWWESNFYSAIGFMKMAWCRTVLDPSADDFDRQECMRKLMETNRADLIALKEVVERLLKLPVKSR
ncbi:MAG: hypothetical protein QXR17_08580 [Candidatus Bathyarchaeia archaeon]